MDKVITPSTSSQPTRPCPRPRRKTVTSQRQPIATRCYRREDARKTQCPLTARRTFQYWGKPKPSPRPRWRSVRRERSDQLRSRITNSLTVNPRARISDHRGVCVRSCVCVRAQRPRILQLPTAKRQGRNAALIVVVLFLKQPTGLNRLPVVVARPLPVATCPARHAITTRGVTITNDT